MSNTSSSYSHDYDWAAELRVRIPPLIAQCQSGSGEGSGDEPIPQALRETLLPHLQRFLDEASRPEPNRPALNGRVVREFNLLLSSQRSQIKNETWRQLIDVVNIIYLQPTAILYTPPAESREAGDASQVPWQGNAVALSPARRFQWPFLASFTRRKVM